MEHAEGHAEAPETPAEGLTRTPHVPRQEGHEKVDAFTEWYLAEYDGSQDDALGVKTKVLRPALRRAFLAGQRTPRPKPPRVPQDTDQLGDAVMRLINAVARRGMEGDLESLVQVLRMQGEAKDLAELVAFKLHHVHGYTWADIGRAAGISKQAAEQRWG